MNASAIIDPALCLPHEASPIDPAGGMLPREAFETRLLSLKRKEPLQLACASQGIQFPKKASLEKLRSLLLSRWYPNFTPVASEPVSNPPTEGPSQSANGGVTSSQTGTPEFLQRLREVEDAIATASPTPNPPTLPPIRFEDVDIDVEADPDVVSHLNRVVGGFDAADDDDEEEFYQTLHDEDGFTHFQTQIRVHAANQMEANRRAGGVKTSRANLKCWNIFAQWAVARGLIKDTIVDEHSLLLYAFYTASRCQRSRNGQDIPKTRVGASQIKKEMFGALRLRKIQEAKDSTLRTQRIGATVYVYDAFRTVMDQALRRKYEGLIEGEDAPDVVANTFLDQLSDDVFVKIGEGFLTHREMRCTVMGHMAWILMNASGCRGDDLRALKICELQPHSIAHPSYETRIPAILGAQSQHKAQKRGLSSTVNPVYTTFIAHRNPEMCPLGAISFYLHLLFDGERIIDKYKIDFEVNKSWRPYYLLHGTSAEVQYSDTSLINLFGQAYKRAGISCHLKQHLARHSLGYKQSKMGVNHQETAKLGWLRDTYSNVYAPAFPTGAILGAHGYRAHEEYRPLWLEITVPPQFLRLFCPMAEEQLKKVEGKPNRLGAERFWQMVITLRPIFFQCAAAMFERFPTSALFWLPALSHPQVKEWMSTVFPPAYSTLQSIPTSGKTYFGIKLRKA